jgi:hypothetical protein
VGGEVGTTFGSAPLIGKGVPGGRFRDRPGNLDREIMSPTFRSTLVRVMAMQVFALLLLWALQAAYHR